MGAAKHPLRGMKRQEGQTFLIKMLESFLFQFEFFHFDLFDEQSLPPSLSQFDFRVCVFLVEFEMNEGKLDEGGVKTLVRKRQRE